MRLRASWNRWAACAGLVALVITSNAFAQVWVYEGNVYPEVLGWQRLIGGTPQRTLEDGWLVQTFSSPDGGQEFYRLNIGGPPGLVGRFFVEWRAITNNPEWLIYEWQVPAGLSAAGQAGVLYHTVMTESAAVLLRDIYIPRVIVQISSSEPHTYRVEVYPDEYIWYIDGVVLDSGVPEGPYPDPDAFIIWGSRWNGVAATTA